MNPIAYPCDHPRTPENTQSVGVNNGVRCRECRRRIARDYARRKAAGPQPEWHRQEMSQ